MWKIMVLKALNQMYKSMTVQLQESSLLAETEPCCVEGGVEGEKGGPAARWLQVGPGERQQELLDGSEPQREAA